MKSNQASEKHVRLYQHLLTDTIIMRKPVRNTVQWLTHLEMPTINPTVNLTAQRAALLQDNCVHGSKMHTVFIDNIHLCEAVEVRVTGNRVYDRKNRLQCYRQLDVQLGILFVPRQGFSAG